MHRFCISLHIAHPTIDPAAITKALGSSYYSVEGQHFRHLFAVHVRNLVPHKAFLAHLSQTGEKLSLSVDFLEGHFGDCMPVATLATMADRGLQLGIVSFNPGEA